MKRAGSFGAVEGDERRTITDFGTPDPTPSISGEPARYSMRVPN
jgi:hypothetical protein